MTEITRDHTDNEEFERIAVVGLAGRFPGANSVDELWTNLLEERDGLHTFSREELAELGINQDLISTPGFVPRGSIIEGYDTFDYKRFGFSPREAAQTDPQARLLLETCHQALEQAGYAPFAVDVSTGVFAGCNPVDYATLLGEPDYTDSLTAFDQMIGNDRDFLATRVSYRLGLTGPALNVQSACSTSLVAVHLAAQHLLEFQCDMALAGGVSLNFRQGIGYFYQDGMILSPDGRCRAFDAGANGTTLGQGCGVVVLKRLSDALADGDVIHAIIDGSAINNDGGDKMSYTAPSRAGQSKVIAMAHSVAGIDSREVTYIEAHGTGTNLGDPVEVEGLTRAFRLHTDDIGFCRLGSIKSSIGHLDAAAGIAGFIKAVMCVAKAKIPTTLHFEQANPAIDFANSPFVVANSTQDWNPTEVGTRRAGISAFGIGGTNAHVVISEPPIPNGDLNVEIRSPRLVLLSAPSESPAHATVQVAREWVSPNKTRTTADVLVSDPAVDILWTGRTHHKVRRSFVVDPVGGQSTPVREGLAIGVPEQVWLFSGQGAQFPGVANGLGQLSSRFRKEYDRLSEFFADVERVRFGDLRDGDRSDKDAVLRLRQTEVTQPAIFTFQLALAAMLDELGCTPSALLGHSIGEFGALVVGGVLSWEDGARAVAARGRMMAGMEPGAMVATRLSESQLQPFLVDEVEIAALNTPQSTVLSGPFDAIGEVQRVLEREGHRTRTLETSHAFHSAMMDEAAEAFGDVLKTLSFQTPNIPTLSNVTGGWLTEADAVNPAFWANQIRYPVRFAQCLDLLGSDSGQPNTTRPDPNAADPNQLIVELGPGSSLSSFVVGTRGTSELKEPVTLSLNGTDQRPPEVAVLDGLGALWSEGVAFDKPPDLVLAQRDLCKSKAAAPLSILDPQPCWLPSRRHLLSPAVADSNRPSPSKPLGREHPDNWMFGRSWSSVIPRPAAPKAKLVVIGSDGWIVDQVLASLRTQLGDVAHVPLSELCDSKGILDEEAMAVALQTELANPVDSAPDPIHVVHVASGADPAYPATVAGLRSELDVGAHALLGLARALASMSQDRPVRLTSVACGAFSITGEEKPLASSAALVGPIKVIPLEYSGISTRYIDIDRKVPSELLARLLLANDDSPQVLAVRGRQTLMPGVTQAEQPEPDDADLPIRHGGHYLLVGGIGGVGLSIAGYLADQFDAKLTLTSRSGRPQSDGTEADKRLALLETVEASAAGVTIRTADAADPEQMREVVEASVAQYGPIDGVFFGAAVADQGGSIHFRTRDAAEEAIAAKVYGAVALAEALKGHNPDFVLLSSSIAAELYHNRFGQVGYVTANSFIEAFAEAGSIDCGRLVTVAWDDWTDVGMSVRAAQQFRKDHSTTVDLVDQLHSFSPADGLGIFKRALVSEEAVIFVSTTDLVSRLDRDEFEENPFLAQAIAGDDPSDLEAESLDDAIRQVWIQLLGTSDFADDDDFFDLGGDSLQVARMADRLSRFSDKEIPLDLVFENPSVNKLIRALSGSVEEAERLGVVHGTLPLAPAQRRFLQRQSVNPHYFNVSLMLKTAQPLEFSDFEAVAELLVRRHDALRTRFSSIDPETAGQIVGTESAIAVRHIVAPVAEWSTHAEKLQHSLDLVDGPVGVFCLFSSLDGEQRGVTDCEQRVFLLLHHMVSDRLSLLLLVSEFDRLVTTGADPAALGPSPTAFSGWSVAINAINGPDRPDAATEQERWLTIAAKLVSPIEFSQFDDQQHRLNERATDKKLTLDRETSQRILSGGQGKPQAVLLQGLAASLADLGQFSGGTSDPSRLVRIDVLGHGRRQLAGVETSRTLGFFLSYTPVWISPNGTDQIATIIDQVDNNWTFDLFSEQLPPTKPAVLLFNFVGRPIESEPLGCLEITAEEKGPDSLPENTRDHPLAVSAAVDVDGCLELVFVYPFSALDSVAADSFVDRLDRALRSVADVGGPT